MKTQITLNFWSNNGMERIYINDANRNALGYFQLNTSTSQRGNDSYYDAHRNVKGDNTLYVHDLTFKSESLKIENVVNQLNAQRPEHINDFFEIGWNEVTVNGKPFNWYALAQLAKNGYPAWYGCDDKKVVAKRKKQRDNNIFEIEIA